MTPTGWVFPFRNLPTRPVHCSCADALSGTTSRDSTSSTAPQEQAGRVGGILGADTTLACVCACACVCVSAAAVAPVGCLPSPIYTQCCGRATRAAATIHLRSSQGPPRCFLESALQNLSGVWGRSGDSRQWREMPEIHIAAAVDTQRCGGAGEAQTPPRRPIPYTSQSASKAWATIAMLSYTLREGLLERGAPETRPRHECSDAPVGGRRHPHRPMATPLPNPHPSFAVPQITESHS